MSRVGASSFITPREIIRDFLTVLDILYQNPEANFNEILKKEEKTFKQSSESSFKAAQNEDNIENTNGINGNIPENEDISENGTAEKAFELKFEDIEI